MKNIYILYLLLALSNVACAQQNTDTLFVAHWNLENLFDTTDDLKTNDEEFLPSGSKEWNGERLAKKMYNLSLTKNNKVQFYLFMVCLHLCILYRLNFTCDILLKEDKV